MAPRAPAPEEGPARRRHLRGATTGSGASDGTPDPPQPPLEQWWRKRSVLAAGVTGALLLVIICLFAWRGSSPPEDGRPLVPPDPELPLPPSPSVERVFSRAAVCSDGRPCSDVGRESRDFCAAVLGITGNTKIAAVPQRAYSLRGQQRVRRCLDISVFCRTTTVFCLYLKVFSFNMSENHFDEYEHYNFEYDKHIYSGHSGKQRTKKEASEHTNHFDPSGHSRKIVTKLQNTEQNKKSEATKVKS